MDGVFSRLRGFYGSLLTPLARLLLRLGVGPNAVTLVGTAGVVAASLGLVGAGRFLAGGIVVLVFLLGDGLDGTMARLSGRATRFGAFLDSTLDRLADAALFTGLALWAACRSVPVLWLALACLSLGFLVSYTRARAEAEGWDASLGMFERTDRLVVCLLGVLAVGLGAPVWVLGAALAVVALGSAFTVGQRIRAAYGQSLR